MARAGRPPDLMIEVPATEAGLPAIEQAIFDGMNINVTLLFKVAQYERVMEAFIRGMERRQEAGGRSTATRSRRSSSRAWTPRSTSGSTRPATRSSRAAPGSRTRAPPTRPSTARSRAGDFARWALWRAHPAPAVRPRPASAAGLSRDALLSDLVAPHAVDAMPAPTLEAAQGGGEVTRATAAGSPPRSPKRWRPAASTSRTSPSSSCARASTRSSYQCRSSTTDRGRSGPKMAA